MPSRGFCAECYKDLQCVHDDYGDVDGGVSLVCNDCMARLVRERKLDSRGWEEVYEWD